MTRLDLPDDACSYWRRQLSRYIAEAADDAFGYRLAMTVEECELLDGRERHEDERDPACGTCSCCVDDDCAICLGSDSIVVDGIEQLCPACTLDECADCGKSTAPGTPEPHECEDPQ